MFLMKALSFEMIRRQAFVTWLSAGCLTVSSLCVPFTFAAAPTGEISLGYTHFWEHPEDVASYQTNMAVIPRFSSDIADSSTLIIEPALRARSDNDDSPFLDPYKSRWLSDFDDWELVAGYDIVFLGATEGAQILDVLNQKDLGAAFDGGIKLGQPMLNLSGYVGEGLASFYYLPYTPKRRFREYEERLSAGFVIDGDSERWKNSHQAYYPGFAARYVYSFDSIDVALFGFHGINREPAFLFEAGRLIPEYAAATQVGVDIQWVMGNMLTKLEALNVSNAPTLNGEFNETTQYVVAGEYSMFDLFNSGIDLRWVGEYSGNSMGDMLLSLYQHDVLLALHTAFNDVDDTQLSISLLHDLDYHSNILEVTLTRRFNQNIELALSLFDFSALSPSDFFYGLEPDSYGEIMMTYYF
ncbi:hypothetical protein D515_00936 [Grimontia indica]|uniref:Uncharacterized protein n=1 Tax=Grimontia indica TaxID=1056512 RepID=R1GUE3_9GAMM|nr:hypothetical protein [Grimontia indica]EOD79803.1 hypothetical protein D515_00936 [Grimontia indica]